MFVRSSSSGGTNTIASGRTARLNTELLVSSASQWAMEMWKAKNASHIPTAPTTTTAVRYIYSQTKTEKLRLSVAEKTGAGQLSSDRAVHRFVFGNGQDPTWPGISG